jgi:hypothetical protein
MKASEVKANLRADIRAFAKEGPGGAGFLTIGQIAEYTGKGVNRIKEYMEGYEYIDLGRRHGFPVDSVVDRILQDRRMA